MMGQKSSSGLLKIDNAFIGIISGITASVLLQQVQQRAAAHRACFLLRKRCVPIVTSFVMVAESAILYFVWPMLFNALGRPGEHNS